MQKAVAREAKRVYFDFSVLALVNEADVMIRHRRLDFQGGFHSVRPRAGPALE